VLLISQKVYRLDQLRRDEHSGCISRDMTRGLARQLYFVVLQSGSLHCILTCC
jgi:hypothetical protein